jgi:hypothetical protein
MNFRITTGLNFRVASTTLLATLLVNGYAVTCCMGAGSSEAANLQWRRALMTRSNDAVAPSVRPSPQVVRWQTQPRFVDDKQQAAPLGAFSEPGEKREISGVHATHFTGQSTAEPNGFTVPVAVNQIARPATNQPVAGGQQRGVQESTKKPLRQSLVGHLADPYDPFDEGRQVYGRQDQFAGIIDERGEGPRVDRAEPPEPVAGGQVVFESDRVVKNRLAAAESDGVPAIQNSLNQYVLNNGEEVLKPDEYASDFDLAGPNLGCVECSCGATSCCDSGCCGESFDRRGWRNWHQGIFPDTRELILFGGVQAFKGPLDRDRDSGNFGFHEGFNWSAKLPWWYSSRIGYQIGYQAVHSQFHGSKKGETSGGHTQNFFTAGLFRRPECGGVQYGIVWDTLRDDRDHSLSYHQVRSEIGLVNPNGREIGFHATAHTNDASNTATPYHALDQFFFYYRIHRQRGGELRFLGGWARQGKGIVGADGIMPLSDRWSLASRFRYLIPKGGTAGTDADEEGWNLSMNLVWHLGCRARSCDANRYRPLFNVADNGSLMVDDQP